MSTILFSLPEFFDNYKKWVSRNPLVASDFETCAKWVSYFIAGRINNSTILSELIYSLSNLLVLFNDQIISGARKLRIPGGGDQLKVYLTVIKYSEVFLELSAKKLWGETGRWMLITVVQLFKCLSKLILLYHHQEPIVANPPVQALQRQRIGNSDIPSADLCLANDPNISQMSFTLQRSGRVIRKISVAPPNMLRDWKPLQKSYITNDTSDVLLNGLITKSILMAETLYVLKPIIHLGAMRLLGTKTWKPWMLSLMIDLVSTQLYHHHRRKHPISTEQQLELSRRSVMFILYLLRSPFYDNYTKTKIEGALKAIGSSVPLTAIICTPLAQYLPLWQDTYFYMWST